MGIQKGEITLNEPRDLNPGVASFVARCYTKALGIDYGCKWYELSL